MVRNKNWNWGHHRYYYYYYFRQSTLPERKAESLQGNDPGSVSPQPGSTAVSQHFVAGVVDNSRAVVAAAFWKDDGILFDAEASGSFDNRRRDNTLPDNEYTV